MLVYLSGQMTGLHDDNFPAFNAAAAKLRAFGHIVLNPAETAGGTKALTRTQFLYIDVGYVQAAEALVMLPGWKNSRGALLELHIAHALEKPAYNYDKNRGVGDVIRLVGFAPELAPKSDENTMPAPNIQWYPKRMRGREVI